MSGPPPITFGAFRLLRPIGEGGQGAVWQAVHSLTSLHVAVKVLTSLRAGDDGARSAFRREVRAAAGLDHPNVIHVLDQGEVDEAAEAASGGALQAGSPWLAMELARGSLGDLSVSVRWADTRAILTAILQALAHAHARGIIHRDLKPHNLLFMDQPRTPAHLSRARLADFGLAFSSGDGLDPSRRVMAGTPLYMAPEQFGGPLVELGPWTDLYAVGWVAWELCAGTHPLRGREMTEIRGRKCSGNLPYWPESVAAPEGFAGWVLRLLELDPRHRYRSAADALAALKRLPDDAPEPGAATLDPPREGAPSSTTVDMLDPLPEPDLGPQTGATADTHDTTWNLDGLSEDIATVPIWSPPPEVDAAPVQPAPMPADWRATRPDRRPSLQGAGLGLLDLRTPPLLGRSDACDALWAALAAARDTRRPQVLMVEGGAGQGKTRLLAWLRQRVTETGAGLAIEVSAGPRASQPGLRGALVRQFGLHGLDAEAARDLLIRRLADLGLYEAVDWRPLADVAGLQTGPPAERPERHAALARLVQALTRDRPVVITLDDAPHSAETLAWLRRLLGREELPLLIVLSARAEDLAERTDARAELDELAPQRLVIPPLPDEALGQAVRALLYLDEGLLHALLKRTSGNPAFALQLLSDWARRDLLAHGRGGFHLADGADLQLPDDLHAAWSARIDRLVTAEGSPTRRAIELAATLGMAVDSDTWRAVCDAAGVANSPTLAERMLDQALAVPGQDPAAGWAFGHGMVRESLLRSAHEASRLAAHHAACAQVLDQRGAADHVVGLHLARAGEPAAALPRLLAGAHERRAADEPVLAHMLLTEATAAADRLGLPSDHPDRHRVRLVEGLVALDAGRFADARDLLSALGEHESAPADVRRAAHGGVAMAAKGLLDIPTALATGQAALHEARRVGDTEAARDLMLILGEASVDIGDIEGASSWFNQSEQALPDLQGGEQAARLLMGRVIVARARRNLDRARDLADRAIELLERLGRRRRLAQALNTKGDLLRYAGDREGAIAAYRRTEQLLSTLGTAYATVPRINLGLTLLALERFEEAGGVLRRTLGEVRAQGHPGYAYAVRHGLLPVAAAIRDRGGFQEHLTAIEQLRERGHFIDPDLAVAAEQAGDLWHRGWDRESAALAWELALRQWEGLQQQDPAQRVRRKLGS